MGTTALEFAILSIPFFTFLLFLFEIGFDYYLQASLDYAIQEGARQIQTGNAQSAPSAAAFKAQYVCPNLGGLIDCNSIYLNVTEITSDFYTQGSIGPPLTGGTLDPSKYAFCLGLPNQLMLVQAIYTSPSIIGLLVPSMSLPFGSGRVRVTSSSVGFINEPYISAGGAGC